MSIPATWLERHRQRHDWALQAFDRFVHELAPEVSDQVRRSDQVTVVVYGATQVGKTTLILDLLGLASSTRDEVARVLRGGQAVGKSATAMPLRYGRAPDDNWYIASDRPLTDVQATKALADIRRSVERGSRHNTDLTDILIPSRLFPAASANALDVDVKLIDLPGLDARNRNEQQLVEQLARRYVTVADLVLLVTQASSLGFLRPENLQIEELAHWASQPVRFRVVVTSCFSLSSERKRFQHAALNAQEVRRTMISEIETLDLKIPPRFADNLYVLELGDSARELAHGEPEYYAHIAPVISEFRQQLITDIKDASGPFSRVFAAFQLDSVVQGQISVFRARYNERKAELDEELQVLEKQLGKHYPTLAGDCWLKQLEDHQASLDEQCMAQKQLGEVLTKLVHTECKALFESLFQGTPIKVDAETVSALQEALDEEKDRLKERCQGWTETFNTLFAREAKGNLKASLCECIEKLPPIAFDDKDFHAIAYHLDSYKTDGYFWTSSFENDKAVLGLAFHKSQQRHASLAHQSFIDGLRAQAAQIEKTVRAVNAQRLGVKKQVKRLQDHLGALSKLQSELDSNLARMTSSLKIAEHFERRINDAFLQALQTAKAGITKGPTAMDKFLAVLNTHLLINEAEKLYAGKPST
ncbi:dynamin family protein [Pseudomonas sp. NPDC089569]|uniref:dynamin family protein n=1 Tax=Pseudomonas sp. NPDC089569 TaxID=3390722 RepID=UPI003D0646BD